MKTTKYYYWVAVNGASAALSSVAMPTGLTVVPTPQRLFGFPTLEEALEAQRLLLEAPMPEARRQMDAWARRPDIACIVPNDPEPPTKGPTHWLLGPEEAPREEPYAGR